MGKAELNKQTKKDSLLNTGFNLFTSKGFPNTSISDIVNQAGVAKGTFYLYFKDKYDLRNKLISHKANMLFLEAYEKLKNQNIESIEDQIVFMIDYIVNDLSNNKPLLNLISKHLSWGVFRNSLCGTGRTDELYAGDIIFNMLSNCGKTIKDPEIMIYMIIELVSGTIYNPILYEQPLTIDEIKPYLYTAVRSLVRRHIMD